MACDSLGEFLTALDDAGELVRIATVVDPVMEATAITERLTALAGDGGPAVWFSGLRNSTWPLVLNLLGHPRRICRALGIDSFSRLPTSLTNTVAALWSSPGTAAGRFAPKLIRQAPCQQVIKLGKDVNLWELPALRSWPEESAPVLQGNLIVFPAEEGPVHSRFSAAALQLVDRQRLLPCWSSNEPALRVVQHFQRQQRQMPVAIVIGNDPLLNLATDLGRWLERPLDAGELGALRERSVQVVKCRSHDLEVPADAEIVIEGFIDVESPWETITSMALPTGHYSTGTVVPAIQVTAITHRANPVCMATVASPGPREHYWRRDAVDRLLLPALRQRIPGLVDLCRPAGSDGRMIFVGIHKSRPFEAQTVAHALWSCPGFRSAKWIIVVDEDVSVRREGDVLSALARQSDPDRDLLSFVGAADPDDHASRLRGRTGKVAIDATRKLDGEGYGREWPRRLQFPDEQLQKLMARWPEFGITGREGTGT